MFANTHPHFHAMTETPALLTIATATGCASTTLLFIVMMMMPARGIRALMEFVPSFLFPVPMGTCVRQTPA